MPHRNAPLSETGRLRLARCVVDEGWPLRRAAERFQVSPTTAKRWADRYCELGEAGMADRRSRVRFPCHVETHRRPPGLGKPAARLACPGSSRACPALVTSHMSAAVTGDR